MNIVRMFVTITLLAFLSQTAMAVTTVTLTGTCPAGVINQSSNYIAFNLSNSGNGAASDLILVPELEGATTTNTTVDVPTIAPGSSYSTRFYLYNFTTPGSYAEYITVKYSQGSSTFVTVFPCLASIMENAQSLVQLNISRTGSKLAVDAINLANFRINANITVTAPPTFEVRPHTMPISVGPSNHSEASFNVSTPSYSNAQFPVVAAVSYTINGVHYAALGIHVISFAASSDYATTAIIFVIIAVIVGLMIASVMKKRKPETAVPQAAGATQ